MKAPTPIARAFALGASLALFACGGGHAKIDNAQNTHTLPPANPVAVGKMVQGVGAAKDGQKDRAVSLFKEAIGIDPSLWEARYNLGVVLANSGDLAGAEDQLRSAQKLAPEVQDVVVALAEVERRRGEHRSAADLLGDYVQAHAQAIDARTLLVAALRNSGQVDKAIEQGREVLVRKPGDASALAELALCHLAKGERETAQLLAKQALDSNKDSAIAHRAMGLIQLQNGDDALAFQSFLKASQDDPRDTTARLNMGGVLLKAGAYAKAEEQYRAILQVSPDDIEAQIGLAAAVRGEADPKSPGAKLEEARSLLTKVLDRDPHNIAALYNLGVLYADFLKRPQDATPLFQRFLSEAPSDHAGRADAEKYLAGAAAMVKPATPPPAGKQPAPKGGK
jgi:tetratricopeptide (TPR) repeat protein